ncbi:hypothetical protein NAPIS_ORF00774 [Vairimorpha apis BRL 01]|uniref:Uncharacterized protein n=1 Tax=Vairimorpha apis BRL 01 TaxID=1037528 RepID=T0L293_9MICR|nr:hypothetical protein NAPIS_ORF00774 [Vairimorpha apis BRL 01]
MVYTGIASIISNIKEQDKLAEIYTNNVVNSIYISLIVFVGIRIFGFFIGNNLNDYTLKRLLNPGGFRTKLRVQAILILLETISSICYNCYIYHDSMQKLDNSFGPLITLNIIAVIFNICILYAINLLHPDLTGRKHLNAVNNFLERQNIH